MKKERNSSSTDEKVKSNGDISFVDTTQYITVLPPASIIPNGYYEETHFW